MSTLGDEAVRLSTAESTRARVADSRRSGWGTRALVWFLLCAGSLLMTLPFLWMVSTSLKETSQIWVFPPQWIPNPIVWQNYTEALTILPFGRYALNTSIITIVTTLGVVLTASLCAYGFARIHLLLRRELATCARKLSEVDNRTASSPRVDIAFSYH